MRRVKAIKQLYLIEVWRSATRWSAGTDRFGGGVFFLFCFSHSGNILCQFHWKWIYRTLTNANRYQYHSTEYYVIHGMDSCAPPCHGEHNGILWNTSSRIWKKNGIIMPWHVSIGIRHLYGCIWSGVRPDKREGGANDRDIKSALCLVLTWQK